MMRKCSPSESTHQGCIHDNGHKALKHYAALKGLVSGIVAEFYTAPHPASKDTLGQRWANRSLCWTDVYT